MGRATVSVARADGMTEGMNELLDITLLVLAVLAGMSALLYVLAALDPQTTRSPADVAHRGSGAVAQSR